MTAERDINTVRRLIIHCGVQKTGSTSLQHFVQRNRDRLLPHLEVMTPVMGTPAQLMARGATVFSLDPTPDKETRLIGLIKDLRDQLSGNTTPVLVSHENLPGAMLGDHGVDTLYPNLEKIIALLDTHLAPMVPEYVFYTREMPGWKDSVYNQAVKTNNYPYSRAVFDADTADCGTWAELEQRVQAQVGPSRVRFFRLEDEVEESMPGQQLLRFAGLPDDLIATLKPVEGRRNPSMTPGALEFLRQVNGLGLGRQARIKIGKLVTSNQSQFCSPGNSDATHQVPAASGPTGMIDVQQILRHKGQVAVTNKDRYQYLQSFGFAPDVVVDVGVHNGTPMLYRAFPNAKFVLIDPRAEAEADTIARFAPRDFDFHAVAVGAKTARMELQIPRLNNGENTAMAGFRKVTGPMGRKIVAYESRSVPVVPLDQIMASYQGQVGIKIDTEGYELEVLQGASETLLRTAFVIIELSVTHRFEDVPPPSRVIAELAKAGLELRDMLRITGDGKGGAQPRLFDALFTRWNVP